MKMTNKFLNIIKKNNFLYVALIFIVLIGIVVRFYRFNSPLADWHSWRQTDTSAVSRDFVQNGFDVLHPKYDDISNIPSGTDNPQGYRFVEFPIFNVLQAGGFLVFDHFNLEQWGRLVSILASVFSIVFIFLLLKKFVDPYTGLIGAGIFALLPYSIYYGRTVLPDESMAASVLAAVYFFVEWIDINAKIKDQKSYSLRSEQAEAQFKIKNLLFYILALFFSAVSLLLKPYAVFFLIPMVYLVYRQWGWRFILKWQLWVLLILSVLPLALWRLWMTQYPAGIPSSSWLFNEGNIRFKGAFFYWIFGERIAKLILGYFGVVFLLLGFLKTKADKNYWFFMFFALASLLYISVIARGNVQHDYYQILIVPTLAIFTARGIRFLYLQFKGTQNFAGPIIIVICSVLMLALSWYYVRDYFNINNPALVEAGEKANQILPKDAKVIAPYGGDTTLLYYTGRQGWPAFEASTEDLMKKGASYVVLLHPAATDLAGYEQKYKVVVSNPDYAIIKLQ